jgi:ABC-type transport system involved in multi-copper enzyme maturation permease subunit
VSQLEMPAAARPRERPKDASIQSNHERIGDLSVLGGILALEVVLFFFDLTWPRTLIFALACFAPALAFNRVGWLKIFGPVFYYDMVRQSRRGRLLLLRNLYCLVLCGFFYYTAYKTMGTYFFVFPADPIVAQGITQTYFQWFLAAQLILVALLTPAFVAGSLAEEKERKTLEFLATTDLLNREIVLSKLGSRLASLGLLVLTGLPILGMLQFVGGIDPNLTLAAYALTFSIMLGEAGVSIACSAICRRPRDAIGVAYVCIVAYYALALGMRSAVAAGYGSSVILPLRDLLPTRYGHVLRLDFLTAMLDKGNPLAVYQEVGKAAATGSLAMMLPHLVLQFAVFHGGIALVTISLAVAIVRRAGLAENPQDARPIFSRKAVRRRVPVGPLPMLWKEIYREAVPRPPWVSVCVFLLVLAATIVPLGWIVFHGLVWRNPAAAGHPTTVGTFAAAQSFVHIIARPMSTWSRANTVVVGTLALFAVGVRAASSILSEREKDTWDTLLSTPVECLSILKAKWAGSILGVRWGLGWLAFVWLAATILGGMELGVFPFVLLAWLSSASLVAVIGLAFSVWCRTSLRAIMATTICTVLMLVIQRLIWFVVGNWLMAGIWIERSKDFIMQGQLTPFDFGYTNILHFPGFS